MTVAIALFASACGPSSKRPAEIKTYTETYAMRVSWDPTPPVTREWIVFKVVIRDKKTGAPIEKGEGRIFANNAGGQGTHDSFLASPESGTYTGRLKFITAGEWAVGIQFRKDSTSKLERPFGDLRLTVRNEQ